MRSIMIALSNDGHVCFRANVGLFFTKDGRPVSTGLPKGFSDLFGHRQGDARAFYIEVKGERGRTTLEQDAFLNAMRLRGAIAGVARSVQDARDLLRNSHQSVCIW